MFDDRCVAERRVSDGLSLEGRVPWLTSPLGDASLGRLVSWTSRLLDVSSLGRLVPDRCFPTLDRIKVLVVKSQPQYISVMFRRLLRLYSPTYNLSHQKVSLSQRVRTHRSRTGCLRDASSKGRACQPRDASSNKDVFQLSKGRIVQATEHPRLFVQGRKRSVGDEITLHQPGVAFWHNKLVEETLFPSQHR